MGESGEEFIKPKPRVEWEVPNDGGVKPPTIKEVVSPYEYAEKMMNDSNKTKKEVVSPYEYEEKMMNDSNKTKKEVVSPAEIQEEVTDPLKSVKENMKDSLGNYSK